MGLSKEIFCNIIVILEKNIVNTRLITN